MEYAATIDGAVHTAPLRLDGRRGVPLNSILFLSLEDVCACGGADMPMAVRDLKKGFQLLMDGEVLNPHKVTLKSGRNGPESSGGLVNVLPALINVDGHEIYGCKALGAMPGNVAQGLPRAQGLMMLFDPKRKSPLCVMDAQVISATRTGAVTCLAASRLGEPETTEIGLVGAGVNMRTQLLGLQAALPHLRRVRVHSRGRSRFEFAAEMGARTGLDVVPYDSAEDTVRDQEFVVTCLPNVTAPVLKAEWIRRRGVTVFNIGCLESEAILLARMDRIVADMWSQGRHRGVQTHAVAVAKGFVAEDRIEDLAPIVTGRRPGRTSRDQNIFFAPTGLGFEDALVAWRVFCEARSRGVGREIELWSNTKWQ